MSAYSTLHNAGERRQHSHCTAHRCRPICCHFVCLTVAFTCRRSKDDEYHYTCLKPYEENKSCVMNRLIFIFVQVNSTHNIQQHLTQLFLLFFNLCREFSGTGDSQRRLRLLYHICETLAWVDRKDKQCQDDKW